MTTMADVDHEYSFPEDGMLSSSIPTLSRSKAKKMTRDDDGEITVAASRRKRIKATKIDHTYRDLAKMSLEVASKYLQGRDVGEDIADGGGGPGHVLPPPSTRNRGVSFPCKLYEMVTNPDYQHIIAFMPHGRSWAVLNKKLLVSVVLPKYFNHSKFESFNRQVNGWGYKRLLQRGPDHKSYYHECFLRGRPELCTLMVRLVNPGKRIPDREHEPNFYDISANSQLPLPEESISGPVISLEESPTKVCAPVTNSHRQKEGSPPLVRAPKQVATHKLQDPADAINFFQNQLSKTKPQSPAAPTIHVNDDWQQAANNSMTNPSWGQAPSHQNSSPVPMYQRSYSGAQQLSKNVHHQDPNYSMAYDKPPNGMMSDTSNDTTDAAFTGNRFYPVVAVKHRGDKMDASPDVTPNSGTSLEATGSFDSVMATPMKGGEMTMTPTTPETTSSCCDSLSELFPSPELNFSNKKPCDVPSIYSIGRDPFLEDGSFKSTGTSSVTKEMSSLSAMRGRDPILDMFAEIYFSKASSVDSL